MKPIRIRRSAAWLAPLFLSTLLHAEQVGVDYVGMHFLADTDSRTARAMYLTAEVTTGSYTVPSKVTAAGVECTVTALGNDGGAAAIWSNSKTPFTLTIPGTVKNIWDKACSNCTALTAVTLNEGLESIGQRAFNNCQNVKSIRVPQSVTWISNFAFANMNSLETLEVLADYDYDSLPSSAQGGSQYAFSFDYLPAPKTFITGGKFKSFYSHFKGSETLETVVLGGELTSVPESAFEGCINLKSLSITAPVQKIGERAFMACPQVKTVTLPETLTQIRTYAFSGCTGLVSAPLPSALKEIMASAFEYCEKLQGVQLPKQLTVLGAKAFYNCKAVASVKIPASCSTMGASAFENCTSLLNVNINAESGALGTGMFMGCTALESVRIAGGVTALYNDAFRNCTALASVEITAPLTDIRMRAFQNTPLLVEITLPSTLLKIQDNAFDGSGIREFRIPSSVTSIGQYALRCNPVSITALNATPPVLSRDICNSYTTTRLIVPYGAEADYTAAAIWSKFTIDSTLPAITSLTLPATMAVNIGYPRKIAAVWTPSDGVPALKWETSDATFATVDADGTVTGKKQGTVTITARDNSGLEASTEVKVFPKLGETVMYTLTDGNYSSSVCEVTGEETLNRTKQYAWLDMMEALYPGKKGFKAPLGKRTYYCQAYMENVSEFNFNARYTEGECSVGHNGTGTQQVAGSTVISLLDGDQPLEWTGESAIISITFDAYIFAPQDAALMQAAGINPYAMHNVAFTLLNSYEAPKYNILVWGPSSSVTNHPDYVDHDASHPMESLEWEPLSQEERDAFYEEYVAFKGEWGASQWWVEPDGKFVHTVTVPNLALGSKFYVDSRDNDGKIYGVPTGKSLSTEAVNGTQYFELWDTGNGGDSAPQPITWSDPYRRSMQVQMHTLTMPEPGTNEYSSNAIQPRYLQTFAVGNYTGVDNLRDAVTSGAVEWVRTPDGLDAGKDVTALPAGIYIVRQGGKTRKIKK